MRRWLIPFFLAPAVCAAAQQQQFSLRVSGRTEAETSPRQVITSALVCENHGAEERAVVLEASLPEGWKTLGDGDRFDLPAGAVEVRIVSFLVPADARADLYQVHFRLLDAERATMLVEATRVVTVIAVVEVSLQVVEQPPFVLAGDEYDASFLLSNTGNADTRLDLSVQSGLLFPYALSGVSGLSDLVLAAGGNVEIRFKVHTPRDIPQSIRNPLRLTVRPHGEKDAPPLAVATSVVETVPVGPSTVSLMNTIPLTSDTTASVTFSPESAFDLQETVKAQGAVDESGQNRVELLVRKQVGSDVDPLSNPNDQYSFRYSSPRLDVRLGDHPFSVSPLVLWDKFARGAQVGTSLGQVDVTSFIFDDIRSAAPAGALGGTVEYTVPASRGAGDYYYKTRLGVLSPLADRALLDLWQRYDPWQNVQFRLDTAVDLHGSSGPSPAIMGEAIGDRGNFSWDLEFLRAWPDFDGYYSDTQLLAATAGVRLLDDMLRLQGKIALTDDNLLMDSSQSSAEESVYASAGASATLPGWQTQASLQWFLVHRTDRLPSPDFSTLQNWVNLTVRQPLRGWDLGVGSTVSAIHDELAGTMQWFQRHELSAGFNPSAAWRLLGSLAYSERWIEQQTPGHAIGASLGARYGVARTHGEVGLNNEWSFSATGLGQVTVGLDGRLVHRFPWEHTVTVATGLWLTWSAPAATPGGLLSVNYSVPLDVPVSRKRDAVAVRGSVVRMETGEPMPGVVVRLNGLASVTDSKGAFDLSLPKSGTHYLQFDQRTLAQGLIPSEDMPYEIVSPPGSDVRLRLNVVQACTVSGSVADYGFPDSEAFAKGEASGPETPQLQRKAGLRGIVVELSSGHERKRRVTGVDGRFIFNEVRPGAWSLAIISGQLPSYHVVEKPVQDITLAPGEQSDVEFRVIQERRRIRMIDLGKGVVVEPAQAPVSGQVIRLGGTEDLEKTVPESKPTVKPQATPGVGPESALPPASRGPEDIQREELAGALAPQESPAAEPTPGPAALAPQPAPEPAALAPQPAPEPAALAPQPAREPAAPAALQTAPQTPVEEVAAPASVPRQPKQPAALSPAQKVPAPPAAARPPAAPPARLKPIPIPPLMPAPSPWPLYLPLEKLPDPVYGPLPQQFTLPPATPGAPVQR